MRGKETDSRRQCCSAGITPAYAGKRTLFCLAGRRNRDHPRACGEKPRSAHQRARLWGSPPRMRGKEGRIAIWACMTGITPAYAGKSLYVGLNFAQTEGSPPRMRGKASLAQIEECNDGITPAYAGKRKASGRHQHCGEDHPRVCGEKKRTVADNVAPQGSPPRMRGKERYFVWQEDGTGITPAYAGKRPPA